MFTNWKLTPQQMIRDKIMGGDVMGGGNAVAGVQQMGQPPMMRGQMNPMAGVANGGPMQGMPQMIGRPGMQQPMPQPMPQSMPGVGDMMGRPMQSNMMGRPMGMPGQNPVMQPRQIMPGNFAGTNGSGLMGYRPGR